MKINNAIVITIALFAGLISTSNAQFQAVQDNASTFKNVPIVIHVRNNDTHPFNHQIVMYSVLGTTIGQPSHGSVEIIGDDILYYPNLNYQGNDNFIYAYTTDGVNFIDTASVGVAINIDTDQSFHANTFGIPPATCYGGKLKVYLQNGTAPYVYQINGSALTTINVDSIIVDNFVSQVGTLLVTDANNFTYSSSFVVPNNNRLLCIDGPMSGYTLPGQCTGNTNFGVWGGTPPFYAIGTSMQGPEQVMFEWEGNDSHSRRAYATGICQGMYNLLIIDSNNLQVTGTFFIDTNSVAPGYLVSQIDTCIAITNYISANVTDVYTNYLGVTFVEWTIVLANSQTVVLNVMYQVPGPGNYAIILYVNCNGDKSTVTLQSGYNITSQDLIASVNNLSFINSIQVYPNPVNDILTIDLKSEFENEFTIDVINILGESLYKTNQNITSGMNTLKIDFNSFDNGVYMIQIVDKKQKRLNLKVIK